jgi:Bacterial PH domain
MEPAPTSTAAVWSPRPIETVAAFGAGLVILALAALADPAGRVLLGIAALGLLAVATADLLLRPRLRADPTGLQVRTMASRHRLPWSAVRRVEVDEHTRYGLTSRTLELEAGELLVVLGKRTLGADPRDVADTLARIRYVGGASAGQRQQHVGPDQHQRDQDRQ